MAHIDRPTSMTFTEISRLADHCCLPRAEAVSMLTAEYRRPHDAHRVVEAPPGTPPRSDAHRSVRERLFGRAARRMFLGIAVFFAGSLILSAPASAGDSPYGGGSSDPTVPTAPPTSVSSDERDRTGASESESLPITGDDAAGLAAIGLASLGGGAVLARRARRRASS
jgi:LPXTG-motif cell wall-anchored protein